MDIVKEYLLKSSGNGGVVIMSDLSKFDRMPEMVGAFTTPADMIMWLAEQYRVPVALVVNSMSPDSDDTISVTVNGEDAPADPLMVDALRKAIDKKAGWIEWGDGERPVSESTRVIVRFRNGEVDDRFIAATWTWSHRIPDHSHDIVAYRVVSE